MEILGFGRTRVPSGAIWGRLATQPQLPLRSLILLLSHRAAGSAPYTLVAYVTLASWYSDLFGKDHHRVHGSSKLLLGQPIISGYRRTLGAIRMSPRLLLISFVNSMGCLVQAAKMPFSKGKATNLTGPAIFENLFESPMFCCRSSRIIL